MIPEEQLKEWEEFLIHQTPGGLNYQMVAVQVIQTLLPAYREQQNLINSQQRQIFYLKSSTLWREHQAQQELIEEQKKEIERLTLDSKRLDFIDNQGIDWNGIGGHIRAAGSLGGDDLRECIDLAMERVSK